MYTVVIQSFSISWQTYLFTLEITKNFAVEHWAISQWRNPDFSADRKCDWAATYGKWPCRRLLQIRQASSTCPIHRPQLMHIGGVVETKRPVCWVGWHSSEAWHLALHLHATSQWLHLWMGHWRLQAAAAGITSPSEVAVRKAVNNNKLARHCCRRTCGTDEIEHLLLLLSGTTDNLGVPLLKEDLYTITGN